jgi:hypothetical protein
MSLATYSDLQTSVANFIHRADLTSTIPDFIRLAEDVIYGDIESRFQDTLVELATVANTETVALPSDFIEYRSIALDSTSTQHETIEYLTPTQYKQQFLTDTYGAPRVCTIIGSNLYLQPIPDSAYNLDFAYTAKIPSLSVTTTTNYLLTNYPSVYLYASLVQAAIYIQDTEKEAIYRDLYNKAIEGVNGNEWSYATPLLVKTDVNLTNIHV